MMKVIFTILFFSISNVALANGFKSEKELRPFTDKLIDQFMSSNFQKALNDAKPYWPVPEVEVDGMANKINQQWPMVSQRFGKALTKEFLKENELETHLYDITTCINSKSMPYTGK